MRRNHQGSGHQTPNVVLMDRWDSTVRDCARRLTLGPWDLQDQKPLLDHPTLLVLDDFHHPPDVQARDRHLDRVQPFHPAMRLSLDEPPEPIGLL